MAKVECVFKLSGTVGDLTFRQTQDGTVAQTKPGPSREKVLYGETFKLTRRNAAEFKLAAQEATMLRRGLTNALNGITNSSSSGRLNGVMYAAAMQDDYHDMGYRHASAGDLSLLEGFDFNKHLLLATALPIVFEHSLDVESGILKVEVPSFVARRKKGFPAEATHFRIVSCGAAVNFIEDRVSNDIKLSDLLPLSKKTPGVICLEHILKVGAGDVLVQVMGIRFYKLVNGKDILLSGGAMRIVEVAEREVSALSYELPDVQVTDSGGMFTARDLHRVSRKRKPKVSLLSRLLPVVDDESWRNDVALLMPTVVLRE
jgi:hypothetical protein